MTKGDDDQDDHSAADQGEPWYLLLAAIAFGPFVLGLLFAVVTYNEGGCQ